jgi:hypothetical protein
MGRHVYGYDWEHLTRPETAAAQRRFDQLRAVRRMRQCGLSFQAIGARLGINKDRARTLALQASELTAAPVNDPEHAVLQLYRDLRWLDGRKQVPWNWHEDVSTKARCA